MLVMPTRRLPSTLLSSTSFDLGFCCLVLNMVEVTPSPPSAHTRLTKHFYYFDLTSREPKNTVFQQNPTVQQAQLDAPMDSDAAIAAAQSSIHLLRVFFSVCRDLVVLRRNPIQSAPKSQIVLFFSKSRQSCTHSSTLRWTQTLKTCKHEVQYIC